MVSSVSGRAYPDVSAQGENFQVVLGGDIVFVFGTSCSSPVRVVMTFHRTLIDHTYVTLQTFAGVISLLNDFLISNGKSPLGFLNPFLYSTGVSGFNDIISGSNPGCGTNGFTAGAGWDPVSFTT